MRFLPSSLFALLSCLPLSAQGVSTDDFESGTNPNGWNFDSFSPDVLETSGGSPGRWLHNSQIDLFTVIVRSDTTTGPWVGDYRATGVSRIHFDAQTLGAVFGAAGRQMSILLRDTKGTALVDDDDYAYSVGTLVPQVGAGWKHFNFEVPSQSTDPVPTGWKGGWVGDPVNFRPGVDWNDVITKVDVVEIWWQDPANFSIFQTWDAGIDNLTVEWGRDAEITATPGIAGMTNTLTMVHASPLGSVRFAGSLTAGFTPFQCNGVSSGLSMSNPRLVATATADALGTATAQVHVASALSGRTVYLQAVDVSECRVATLEVLTLQ